MERIDWKGVIIPKVKELLGSFSYRPLDLPWEKTDKAKILRKEALGK